MTGQCQNPKVYIIDGKSFEGYLPWAKACFKKTFSSDQPCNPFEIDSHRSRTQEPTANHLRRPILRRSLESGNQPPAKNNKSRPDVGRDNFPHQGLPFEQNVRDVENGEQPLIAIPVQLEIVFHASHLCVATESGARQHPALHLNVHAILKAGRLHSIASSFLLTQYSNDPGKPKGLPFQIRMALEQSQLGNNRHRAETKGTTLKSNFLTTLFSTCGRTWNSWEPLSTWTPCLFFSTSSVDGRSWT